MEILLKTLTPVWTGGVDQICDRLHETGLIGSLRWWYEALVRGLGGYACDPTSEERCPDKNGQRCVVCELFGCTGWGRKFRLQIVDGQGNLIEDALTRANVDFTLRFLELRTVGDEEKWLLVKSVEIASKYGALGGKTTLKPQKGKIGADYGIVQVHSAPNMSKPNIELFLRKFRQVPPNNAPDLRWFFFIKGTFLWRRQMNALMGLSPDGQNVIGNEPYQQFLRGRRGDATHNAISKKLFSFRADSGRIWGYTRDAQMRDTIVEEIKKKLGKGNYIIKTGEEVLHEL